MFTGFASENTPAIQIWDFAVATANPFIGPGNVSLQDDCAPIQFFKTGGTSSTINIYLPSAPIEGKQIKIINARYGSNAGTISIFSSDVSGGGTSFSSSVAVLGSGTTLDFCYSKNFISFGPGSGTRATGWITLNQGPAGAANNYAVAIGGDGHKASSANCFIGGGSSNTITSGNSVIVGGQTGTISNQYSFIAGGQNNAVSGFQSAVIAGSNQNASGSSSFIGGGSNNLADAGSSSVVGGTYGSTRSIVGNTVAPASANPIVSAAGVTQSALLVLGVQTTNATATILRSNTSAATTINQVILPNNSAYVFQGTCIANVTGGSTTSGWKFEGVIKRGANAASTTLVAAVTPTVIAQDVAAATWVLAITADTTNGGIAVTVTGAAATTIRWVSRIESTEVTF